MFELFNFNKKKEKPDHSREAFEDAEKEEEEAWKERVQDRHRPAHMRDPEGVEDRHWSAQKKKQELLDAARAEAEQEDAGRDQKKAA